MSSSWNTVGKYSSPLVTYIDNNSSELTIQFYEFSRGMFIQFTNPTQDLVNACGKYCHIELAANGRDMQSIYISPQYMHTESISKFVIDQILNHASFDTYQKNEIRSLINACCHQSQRTPTRGNSFFAMPSDELTSEPEYMPSLRV